MRKTLSAFAVCAVALSLAVSACGNNEAKDEGVPMTDTEAREMLMGGMKAPKDEAIRPVRYDVVGIRPGMGAKEVVTRLEKDGWSRMDQRLTQFEFPGVAPYEAPEMISWLREGQDGDAWKSEILAVHFAPALPKEDAPVYLLIFDRRYLDQAFDVNRRYSMTLPITAEFSLATLTALKSKYGEPPKFEESACEARGAGNQPSISIPIYELDYPQGSANKKALNAKVGDTCGQSLAIRIEDSVLASTQRRKMEDLRAASTAAATKAKPGMKTDF